MQNKNVQGVTLIELMLALVISSILLLGVGTIYSSSKRGYVVQEEFAKLQENARIAMNFLVKDIRMAGFIGCAWNNQLDYENFLRTTGNASNDNFLGNFRIGMEGFEATNTGPGNSVDLDNYASGWTTALPPVIAAQNPHRGSDVIIIRRARDNGITMSNNKDAANFRISDQGVDATNPPTNCHSPSEICAGDVLLITDCQKSRLFQATDVQNSADEILIVHAAVGTPGNAPAYVTWGEAADTNNFFSVADSELFKATAYAYYISTGASGEPSLFRLNATPGSTPEELVEGVENMQVLFGIDTDKADAADTEFDGVANRYVTAENASFNNDNVVSARISLLLRTNAVKQSGVTPANPFKLGGTTNATSTRVTRTVADTRVRKVFTTTIKIRNKGLN